VTKKPFLTESALTALAKKTRKASGKRKAQVARELGVSAPSLHNAEERPEMSLHKLRIRMIEAYSAYKVVGPVYYLKRK
jgi:DNA-binding XRE family transcriptional regulator